MYKLTSLACINSAIFVFDEHCPELQRMSLGMLQKMVWMDGELVADGGL
jgi:hypothetical protein